MVVSAVHCTSPNEEAGEEGWQITLKTVRGPAQSHSLLNLLDHNLQPWGMGRVTVLGYTYTETKCVKWEKKCIQESCY